MVRADGSTQWGFAGGAALLLLLSCVGAHAGDFETANELYDAGRFTEAKQLYEKLVDANTRSANLFHNLGNTDFRLGSPGRAVLGYERALALDPAHPEAAANLKLLQEQTHARDLHRPFAQRGLLKVSENVWTVVAMLVGWAGVFALVRIFTAGGGGRIVPALCLLACALVAGTASFGLSLHAKNRALAIVTAREVEAHLAPAESAALAGILPAGSRVRVLSERGPWTYCELPDDRRGWLATSAIERIRLGGS